ncbi:tRNA (5-methylaminomethyl-2-thiouridine)(34)-methyltransferase MnmD [Phenylobacterium sp.]|jgi:tRNA 5-methylaminomethyl-2-thiouridine biosynthesis bifunctional protein|uniref:tRNA (5-methylaminomethyl-2-thiouridine)(34)-methyltransferase MnmD n=1 Tax=Phenylobacterium sp. TaxID=1871053 RepID=UPI0037CBC6DA
MTTDAGQLDWTSDGQPRSRRFGDVYFSTEDGLAEARAVFLRGCGLPDAWQGRRRFVVGELGFGAGLNTAALLDQWRQTRPSGAVLHVFSIEAFPISAEDAARALSRWPALMPVVAPLIAGWPGQTRGRYRLEFPHLSAILDVAVMDVVAALQGWSGCADAWFLDGFSPALNPDMWREEVLALVAARSAPGARAATFTVAGQVRRGLSAAGFTVEKQAGFGRKRERLEAVLAGTPGDLVRQRVAIVGGGIAGASAARAVRALGGEAVVIEAQYPGAGASGNPAALVTPRLDAGLGEAAGLFAQAFARAGQLYDEVPGAVIARGALQFTTDARDLERYGRISHSDLFPPKTMNLLGGPEASARMGEADLGPALDQPDAMVVDPAPILTTWIGEPRRAHVGALEPAGEEWRLLDGQGAEIVRVDAVILAAALGTDSLAPGLPLSAVRGQASWTTDGAVGSAAAFGGYVTATRSGILFGSTHDRDDTGADLRPEDHARNLATLRERLPRLAESVQEADLQGRASVRAVSRDMTPIAGETDQAGVYVLTGFGSRGFSLAPLLAEHVAALALGAPSPISVAAAGLVAPGRFARRAARRGRS